MLSHRAAVALVIALGAVAGARDAWSQPAPGRRSVELVWSAPRTCPGREQVLAEVTRLLGRQPDVPIDRPLAARGAIVHRGAHWRVQLETTTSAGIGRRAVDGTRCAQVATAAALILALAIDPTIATVPVDPIAPIAAPPQESAPPRPDTPASAPTSDVHEPVAPAVIAPVEFPAVIEPIWHEFVGVAFAIDAGTLTAIAPGVAVDAGIAARWIRFELALGWWAPQSTQSVQGNANLGAQLQLLTATSRACARWRVAGIRVGPCAGFEIGTLTGAGTGSGLSGPGRTGTSFWLAALGGGAVEWEPTRNLTVRAGLDAGIAVYAPTFVIDNVGTVHRPAPIVARAHSAIEFRF